MNFNGKYWHKPGHLGMTTDEVKAALKALPTPEAGDAGKAVVVNADADGYELGAAGGGGGLQVVGYVKMSNKAVSSFTGSVTVKESNNNVNFDWYDENMISTAGAPDYDYMALHGFSIDDATQTAIANINGVKSNLFFKVTNITGSSFNLANGACSVKFVLFKAS